MNALSPNWNQEIAAIPRAAFTLVERRAQRLLKKYSLEAVQVIESTPFELAREVLRQGEAAEILDDFDGLQRSLSGQITSLKNKLEAEDPTVAAFLEGAARKIQYQIDKVSRRFVLNQAK